MTTSPQIVISDRFLRRKKMNVNPPTLGNSDDNGVINTSEGIITREGTTPGTFVNSDGSNNERSANEIKMEKLRKWKISFAIHMLIPAYGFLIVLLVFFPNLLG
jgi:hypothetical protein